MSRQPGPRIDPPMDPRIDPDGKRLPIKLDSTSNGEFVPVPLSGVNRAANRLAPAVDHAGHVDQKARLRRQGWNVGESC